MELTQKTDASLVRVSLQHGGLLRATLNRMGSDNALDSAMIAGLHAVCDRVELNDAVRMLVIDACGDLFCSGMDFRSATETSVGASNDARGFAELLARLAALPSLVVACVEKPTIAGGVGLAAACDLVVAGPAAQFRLTEAMWGLQPANVAPYLIRRMGFQRAYAMALTMRSLDAAQARDAGLVDILTPTPGSVISDLRSQSGRISRKTRAETKALFAALWLLDEDQRRLADDAMALAVSDPEVQRNLNRYLTTGRFPWEENT